MTSSSNTDSAVTSVFELTSVGLEENRWRDGAQALGKYSRTLQCSPTGFLSNVGVMEGSSKSHTQPPPLNG